MKGSTHELGCWFNYGYCNGENIELATPMSNRASSFYKAQIIALVCVETPSSYCCVLLPVGIAEQLARLNIEREFKPPRRDGSPKKPGKVWSSLNYVPTRIRDDARIESMKQEQDVLGQHKDKWNIDQY